MFELYGYYLTLPIGNKQPQTRTHTHTRRTDLALFSSLHSPPGFIDIHWEIHPKQTQKERTSKESGHFDGKVHKIIH